MGKPYKFSRSASPMPSLPRDECKRTGCGSGCGKNPIRSYLKELSSRMKGHGLTLKEGELLPPKGFEETGDLNPFEIVSYIYSRDFSDGLDACLSRKMDIHDCVYGCYSGITDGKPDSVHPHQMRVKNFSPDALPEMSKILTADVENQTFEDFEGIVSYLDRLKEEHRKDKKSNGFGNLAIYDTALRLAWNAPEGDRETLMPKKVWIQQGACEGADYLNTLGQLRKAPYRYGLNKNKLVSDRDDFPAPISRHEPYHIENILCIFHPLFEKWAGKSKKKN